MILAAGLLKLPDLFGDLCSGIRGQVLIGSLAAGLSAYAAVKFLTADTGLLVLVLLPLVRLVAARLVRPASG